MRGQKFHIWFWNYPDSLKGIFWPFSGPVSTDILCNVETKLFSFVKAVFKLLWFVLKKTFPARALSMTIIMASIMKMRI